MMKLIIYLIKLSMFMSIFRWSKCANCSWNQRRIFVISGTNLTQCEKQNESVNFNCPSLEIAFLQNDNLNKTCIIIANSSQEILHRNFTLVNVHHFTMVSIGDLMVKCRSFGSGLAFHKSSNIIISVQDEVSIIAFEGCGIKIPSWTTSQAGKVIDFVATLYFKQVENVSMTSLAFQQYFGYGVIMQGASGIVTLKDLNLLQNTNETLEPDGYNSGGGIHIYFAGDSKQSNGNLIRIQNCVFDSLTTEMKQPENEDDVSKNSYNAFARGGGLSVFFQNSTANNSILVQNCSFRNNKAVFGGAVYIRNSDYATDNTVKIENVTFFNNSAVYAGGAVIYVGSYRRYHSSNRLQILHSHFYNNNAKYGGGVCFWKFLRFGSSDVENDKFEMNNTNFRFNTANIGSSMYCIISSISIYNCYFSNNDEIPLWDKQGAITIYLGTLHIYGYNEMNQHGNTALCLDHAMVRLYGSLLLQNNTGQRGGAVAIFGHSKISLLEDCVLKVFNNTATEMGGAFYVDVPGNKIHQEYVDKDDCFITINNNSIPKEVICQGNTANGVPNLLYATTVKPCNYMKEISMTHSHCDFNGKIKTDPAEIIVHENEWHEFSPGMYYPMKVNLVDELRSPTHGEVNFSVLYSNSTITFNHGRSVLNESGGITFSVNGARNTEFQLQIHVPDTSVYKTIPMNSSLTAHCPFFYHFVDNQCKCYDVQNKTKLGISQCFLNRVYLFTNRWAPELEHNSEKSEMSFNCPYKYCKKCNLNESINGKDCRYYPREQCHANRNQLSRLCSMCLSNHTLQLSDDVCQPCGNESEKKPFLFQVIVFIFIMICFDFIFIVLIICCNNVGYASYLVPFIYFYKFVAYFMENVTYVNFIPNILVVMTYFKGAYMMTNFLPRCFLPNVNNLEKLWVIFGSSLSWFIAYVLIYLLTKSRTTEVLKIGILKQIFTPKSCQYTFKIIFYLFVTELLTFSFETLKKVEIEGVQYVYVFANEKFFEGLHIPLVLIASLSLLFLVLYVVTDVFWVMIPRLKSLYDDGKQKNVNRERLYLAYDQCKYFRDSYLNWYKSLARIFQHGFKNKRPPNRQTTNSNGRTTNSDGPSIAGIRHGNFWHIIFSAFFLAFAVNYHDYERNTILTLICVVYLFIFAQTLPYENEFSNKYELFVVGDLIMVGVITDSMDGISDAYSESVICVIVLLCLPALVLFTNFFLFIVSRCITLPRYFPFSWTCGRNTDEELVAIQIPMAVREEISHN